MKVTEIWVYPIKALRGISLPSATLNQQGIQHDRRFMLFHIKKPGELVKMQLDKYPKCSLFSQEIVGDSIHVRYLPPPGDGSKAESSAPAEHDDLLEMPLEPDTGGQVREDINLHQSLVKAYRMGGKYDAWFSACFGMDTALFYMGNERRPILGTFAPQTPAPSKGWLSSISSYITSDASGQSGPEPHWLNFSDHAPFLITTNASLQNVSDRLSAGSMQMYKFRPNIVLDGESSWDEDFWEELSLMGNGSDNDGGYSGSPVFTMSKLCNRCTSINVDYDTGRPAEGERGTVLKKLMSDRRVDEGYKHAPAFGHYAFLAGGRDHLTLKVGNEVAVSKRSAERPVYDWPARNKEAARFYRYS